MITRIFKKQGEEKRHITYREKHIMIATSSWEQSNPEVNETIFLK